MVEINQLPNTRNWKEWKRWLYKRKLRSKSNRRLTQTRSTPRAEFSIGIGYVVADKQELNFVVKASRARHRARVACHRSRPPRVSWKSSLCASVAIPAWSRHRRVGVPLSASTVTMVPVLVAGTITARESGHPSGARRVRRSPSGSCFSEGKMVRFEQRLMYSRLPTLVPVTAYRSIG